MAQKVQVRSLSVFHGSAESRMIAVGDVFEVTPERRAELAANGLVEDYTPPEPAKPPVKPAKV